EPQALEDHCGTRALYEMDQTPPVRSEYLVSGIRTPPVRRNSKLATLGRIFKPWKWRKKKNEKLKQTTSALEKKMAGRQGREDLIKKGLLEMMEQDAENKACSPDGEPRAAQSEPSTPRQEPLTSEEATPGSPLATGTDQASLDEPLASDNQADDAAKVSSASREEEADAAGSLPPSTDEPSQALAGSDSLDSPPRPLERSVGQLPSPPLLPTPPPKAGSRTTRSVTGQATLFQGSGGKSTDPALRGQLSTPTGSPHLTTVHRPLPPSRVIEELHRALATKHRQDSRHLLTPVISSPLLPGTLPRKCKKELLAVKLRNRPSRQELEDRNIFPQRTDEERQEIRQQIEMKLSKPTVDELRDRKILIRFSDYVEVAKAQDYDRRADKPWTRLSAADKAAIRKELNEYKSNEMEVHASSKHLTRSPGEGNGWLPTPVFFSGEFHRQRNLVGYSPWGHKELDRTVGLTLLVKGGM
ncbi:hypothetical protein FD755_006422, partial [Muntiacus reevesi]